MLKLLQPLAALFVTTGLALAEAEAIATRTGEVIGAATQCGVSDQEAVALGRKVIAWARELARDADDLKRAQAAHEAAVRRGAEQARHRSGCEATLRSFRELEQERR